jgi:hypothetical protein
MAFAGALVGLLLLVAFAFTPVLTAGLLAPDWRALLAAEAPFASERPPLAELSLVVSRWFVDPAAAVDAGPRLHVENLALLLLAAAALGLAVRRLLRPWTGSEHAGPAAAASAAFLALHPLTTGAVGSLAGRGPLLALALSAAAALCFLRGRQDRRPGYTAAALGLAVLAGLSDPLALGLPFVLAGAEFASAHRWRPKRVRVRTATTTLAVFGAAAGLESLWRLWNDGPTGLPPAIEALGIGGDGRGVWATLVRVAEKLGVLVLPANEAVLGLAGTALAGLVFLVAMRPGLVAARTAPRLWGWLLCAWLLALVGSTLLHAHEGATGGAAFAGPALLPSVAVLACGMGLATTAVSGPSRTALPIVIALAFAALSHGGARPWSAAATGVADLVRDLAEQRGQHGRSVPILVIDPPPAVGGIDPLGDDLPWLTHALLDSDAEDGAPLADVRALSLGAFLAYCRQPEFPTLAGRPLLVVAPAALTTPGATGRFGHLLQPPGDPARATSWRGEIRSPALDLPAFSYGSLRVAAPQARQDAGPPRLAWSLREESQAPSLSGAWVDVEGEPGAVFDLGGSLAWRLAGRVRLVWFEEGITTLEGATFDARPLSLGEGLLPVVTPDGVDWQVNLDHAPATAGELVVGLLDLDRLRYDELPCTGDAPSLRVPGAASRVAELLATGDGPVAWFVDLRVGDVTVARASGRRLEAARRRE